MGSTPAPAPSGRSSRAFNVADCGAIHPFAAQPVFALTSAVVRDRTLILVITSVFARVGARSIPGLHRGGPGFVILADQ